MSDIVDMNKVATAAFTSLVTNAFNSVSAKATSMAKDAWAKIFEDFAPFMKDAYQRNAYVRLLSQKDKDVELYSVYVQSAFTCDNNIVDDEKVIYRVREGKNVVINGNGGAGKTFFMRHLWLTLFKNAGELTPIFIELRKLNDLTNFDLKSFIRLSISRKKELDNDLFSYFCSSGRFCFILDGFDEIVQSQRDSAQRQILQLSSDYPLCRFVVSSRYERRFAGWQNFDLYESLPFDLAKVKRLVELVPFEPSAKKLFQKQLDEEFYEQNKSFLSNPLLAIMMMMTFKENMDIPRRMNIFYDQAFTTLFQWHDATKAFNREKTLDIDEFQRSFASFCLLSYHQEKFEFTKSEVIDLINKSNKLTGISKKAEDILKDYEETVNLLKQEGLKYVFIHRSFQEYFCAYAITILNPSKFPEIFSGIRNRHDDSVLLMCFEMNKGIVVDGYIKPLFNKIAAADIFTRSKELRYDSLAAVSAYYGIHLSAGNEHNNRTVESISYSMNPDVEELINNINRLMGHRAFGIHHSGALMYAHEIFMVCEEIAKSVNFKKDLFLALTFGDDDIVVEVSAVEDHTTKNDDTEKLRERVQSALKKRESRLAKINSRVGDELDNVRVWCEQEINLSDKREQSLDTILGL